MQSKSKYSTNNGVNKVIKEISEVVAPYDDDMKQLL